MIIVTNPGQLPPPGKTFGSVDHPCRDEIRYEADWTVGTEHFKGVVAQAHAVIMSNFGVPTLTTNGSDVITTFTATLTGTTTIALGEPVDNELSLNGSISVRIYGKALATTGTFLAKVESMSFTSTELPSPSGWTRFTTPWARSRSRISTTGRIP